MTTQVVLHSDKSSMFYGLRPRKDLTTLLQSIRVNRVDKVLIVLLDSSGSMTNEINGKRKIDVAYTVLREKLMPNMAGWVVGVLIFHGLNEVNWVVYPSKGSVIGLAGRVVADGGTPMTQALLMAWNWVKHNASQARFILLSDGEPDSGQKSEIPVLVKAHSTIPIDTIGIGQFDYDPEFLRLISDLSGGIFSEAESVKALSDMIVKLAPANRPILGPVAGRGDYG